MEEWRSEAGTPEVPPSGHPAPEARPRGREVRLVATGAAFALLVWFAFANLQRVSIHFWVSSASAPLVVVVAISGFLGAAASGLWSWARRRRREEQRS